jgi:hypothetical protein
VSIALIDQADRDMILSIMQQLLYETGVVYEGTTQRTGCISFREREENDKDFLRIRYGNGCSCTVRYILFVNQ